MMLDILYFFEALPREEREVLTNSRFGNDGSTPDYRDMARMAIASARRFHPGCHIVHATDEKTEQLDNIDAVFRLTRPSSVARLTFDAADCFSAWGLQQAENPWVWTEPDSLFARPVDPVFTQDFDIATVRRISPAKEALPYTSGLVYVKPTSGTRDFLSRYRRVLHAVPEMFQFWWCDMMILSIMLGIEAQPGDTVRRHGAKVLLLSVDEHLGLPKKEGLPAHPSSYYTLHFKGMRQKALMEAYFSAIDEWARGE